MFQDFAGSKIWNHFKRSVCGKLAECNSCKKVLKCEGGSTKGLHNRLKSQHQIDLLKRSNNEESAISNTCKVRKLDYYMNDASLPAVLARMTACDGLSFNIFTTSMDLRKSLAALGHSLPRSVVGIRDQVLKYGQQLRQDITRNLSIIKSKGQYFSLTLDEWTSLQNKRYLNINIHGIGFFWNLGLVRIKGRFSSEACSKLISLKLKEFAIEFETDVISITTDGCSMMKKLGKIIPTSQQLCYAHGLQLVIQDVFYQKQLCSSTSETDEDEDMEMFDDFNDDGFIVSESMDPQNALALNFDISKIVTKVRRIVKIFKRSPLKNETLQAYVKEIHPNGLNVVLDCKTRWSSLVNMLERIIQIKLPVQKALLDFGGHICLSDQEIAAISSIVEALNPIKIALKALCRRDTNLITAEATIKFLLEDIQKSNTHYHTLILEALSQRMVQERYTEVSAILQYLHNPSARLAKKAVVNTFCADLLSRTLRKGIEDEEHVSEEVSMVPYSPNTSESISDLDDISLAKRLQLAIDASMKKPEDIQVQQSLSKILKYELTIGEQTGKRGYHLEKVYQMLLTIPATSVEAERAFSCSAYLCNKFRTRLSDSTLDTLAFIRSNKKN